MERDMFFSSALARDSQNSECVLQVLLFQAQFAGSWTWRLSLGLHSCSLS